MTLFRDDVGRPFGVYPSSTGPAVHVGGSRTTSAMTVVTIARTASASGVGPVPSPNTRCPKAPSVVRDQRSEPPSAFGGQRCVGVGGVHAGGGASCDLKVWTRSVVHCSGISQGMKWPPLGWAAMLPWLYQAARSLATDMSEHDSFQAWKESNPEVLVKFPGPPERLTGVATP